MKLFERFWTVASCVLNFAAFSSCSDDGALQRPLQSSQEVIAIPRGPIFTPPGHDDGTPFKCNYSSMVGWHECSTPEDRECWLANKKGGRFDIHTNYEHVAPKGILRKYSLTVTNSSINQDGLLFPEAKLFNATYPGPWLQACWGDEVEVTVYNHLPFNGTSIHWHGIRMNQTMHMDGVNGITQCPIAPGDSFTYKFKTTQYGSSWYHSHYSLQYADGMFADRLYTGRVLHRHNSAFDAIYNGLKNPSILLNGHGNVTRYSGGNVMAKLDVPEPYNITFDKPLSTRPKRYLLRLINTSFDMTFVFSIDNHWLTVVGADFVPIHSYNSTSVLIGIGQRYNVIVEAIEHTGQLIPQDGNFWIRTYVSECRGGSGKFPKGYEKTGILRYNSSSKASPTSKPWTGEEFDVHFDDTAKPWPLAKFSLELPTSSSFNPLRIDYDDPTFLNLNKTGNWSSNLVIVPENYKSNDWVYLVLEGDRRNGRKTAGAHLIHLHGHDFAILQQEEGITYNSSKVNLTLNNPPRRDVVLLPANGFVIIAFKADNPGSWLMHCHIAKHASEGLALQILERQGDANETWPFHDSNAIKAAEATCAKWKTWHNNCTNYWPGGEAGCVRNATIKFAFQDDSGI
ncbi:hypothetical protein G7Y89_g8335 [Cudoniella acicularis]|uniref:Laccase n=1 Tax=Cudoniella acicularis TaxID=354080 RepID=A0A8H4RGT7_9HELO|nr:hypothetical protein G7Y89_g8335 [Cudoniella acicularis]